MDLTLAFSIPSCSSFGKVIPSVSPRVPRLDFEQFYKHKMFTSAIGSVAPGRNIYWLIIGSQRRQNVTRLVTSVATEYHWSDSEKIAAG
jgi:hypothetical protein